ncbi:MAG: acetoin dehydrogenase dihydrolipoyllysine-residue acetyltransferase subunit [Pseudomonadota bacterium]
MMGTLKMPRMGETMEEGKLLAWLVEPGQPFKRGEPLLEVETDKTVVEFPALGDGLLVELLVELGEMIDVGAPIARIDVGDGPDWISDGETEEPEKANPNEETRTKDQLCQAEVLRSQASSRENGKVRATPLARFIAGKTGIDLLSINGTGRRGRVERGDVLAAANGGATDVQDGLRFAQGLAYVEKGAANGTPVLFVHGFAADHSAWAGLQISLARSGNRTLAVDLPGHGRSSLEACDVDDLAAPLQALIQERLGWSPVHIVAHSMGAIAAIALAQNHPVASVTLIAPAGVGQKIDSGFLEDLAQPLSADHVKRVLMRLTAGSNGLSDGAIATIFEALRKRRVAGLAKSLTGTSGQAVDIRAEVAELAKEVPVSILLGHRDQIIDWSEALDISPLVSMHHFATSGHMPHWEEPVAVQQVLKRKTTS